MPQGTGARHASRFNSSLDTERHIVTIAGGSNQQQTAHCGTVWRTNSYKPSTHLGAAESRASNRTPADTHRTLHMGGTQATPTPPHRRQRREERTETVSSMLQLQMPRQLQVQRSSEAAWTVRFPGPYDPATDPWHQEHDEQEAASGSGPTMARKLQEQQQAQPERAVAPRAAAAAGHRQERRGEHLNRRHRTAGHPPTAHHDTAAQTPQPQHPTSDAGQPQGAGSYAQRS